MRAWLPVAHFLGATLLFYVAILAAIFFLDPYGRSGYRSSSQVANLSERYLMVTRAMDPAFDAAVVGNSTSIPLQPDVLDRLTGLHFVSLSISGSQAPAAIAVAKFFLAHHPAAKTLVVALDDSWCTDEIGMAEAREFPFWLYGSRLAYAAGLFTHASKDMLVEGFHEPQPGSNRRDGYHPYDAIFHENHYDDLAIVTAILNRTKRRAEARYPDVIHFAPQDELLRMIGSIKTTVNFVLLWTPRYISLIPLENTEAAAEDFRCKQQMQATFAHLGNVQIIDWSGPDRPENHEAANFYETNHYRDSMAILIEKEIAALRG